MAELATWLHSRGFKLGLYMTAGNETCALGNRHIPGEPHARGIPGSCAAGPPTATSCRQQYERDTRDVASWGSDFVKLDWCRFNGTASSEESLTTAFGAALNATGRNSTHTALVFLVFSLYVHQPFLRSCHFSTQFA